MKPLRAAPLLAGTLFLLVASSSLHAGIIFTNIFSFNGTNGDAPTFLVRAGNKKFYGITVGGGPNYVGPSSSDVGGIYSITSDGVFSNLCFFEKTNGSGGAYLTPGTDGNFYGTTGDSVFELNPDGTMANPNLAPALDSSEGPFVVLQDSDGTVYGTTEFHGPSGYGRIYKIDTNGVFSTLAAFHGTNGIQPVSLLLGADNSFYGLTQHGGNDFNGPPNSGDGTIFRVDRSGNITNLFLFSDPGDEPNWMMQGPDGDLYGVTGLGGTNGAGSVFRVTTNGVLVWSFSFNGTNGYFPILLTTANDGNFYGVTEFGGSSYNGTQPGGFGTIFRITPNGSFTILAQFDGTNDVNPRTVIQGTDGDFYGTALGGGAFGLGAVFKLSLPTCPQNRLMLTDVANFTDTNAPGNVFPRLTQANDGLLYGVTQDGGAFAIGTIFRSTLSGSLTTLVTFNGTNGAYPVAPPLLAADGNFYGTTANGGPEWNPTNGNPSGYAYGSIYRMDSNGILTTLFSFNQTNGAGPGGASGLIVGNDGSLYGVAQQGGPNFTNINHGDGTIFKITTNGDFTMLASFNGTNGFEPTDIIQASDGNFYGTTSAGGVDDTNGFGTVFRMTPDGQINTLVRFSGTNGAAPTSIMQASDGCLYGTTGEGGAFFAESGYGFQGYGTVFKLTTNSDFTLLASFDATNGMRPWGLVEACYGLFYGTTSQGGLYPQGPGFAPFNNGTFFQVATNGDLTVLVSFGADQLLPVIPYASLIRASDGNYYGTAQSVTYTNSSGNPSTYPGAIFCIRPVQAPVLQPLAQPGQLNLNWNAWAGYSYDVMYETNLTGSNWNLLSTFTALTNGITSYSDPIGPDTQRFYEVILQLP